MGEFPKAPPSFFGVLLELTNDWFVVQRTAGIGVKDNRFSKNTNLMVQVKCRWLYFLFNS
jgi:hypothetical protein